MNASTQDIVHRSLTARFAVVLLMVLVGAAGGCGPVRYWAYLTAPQPPGEEVPAEFTGLEHQRVAIVIYADERIQYEHPYARLTLASTIRGEMLKHLEGVSVTDPAKVGRYQDDNIHWEMLSKAELAEQFGVDYVLYISLMEYSTREVGSIDLYRGRITAECGLYRAGRSDEAGQVWRCDRLAVVYPEKAPAGVPRESDRTVREAAERLFADALVKKFYTHKVPVE